MTRSLCIAVFLAVLPRAALGQTSTDSGALVVNCGDASTMQVALTFDDGPTAEYTPKVLEVLRRHKVKAAFFVTGLGARQYPQLIRAIAAQGHLVATHSFHHPRHASSRAGRKQILLTEKAIRRAGVVPSRYYRPPYGIVTDKIRQLCQRLRYHIVLYSFLSPDYRRPPINELVAGVRRFTTPGGIVVMHDGGGDRSRTVEALPTIIKELSRRYKLVRLDELLGPYLSRRNRCKK